MPLCFAYGSNLDVAAMRSRCPASRPLGAARLMRHRLFVMANGYLSVRRDPARQVHGLLWDIAAADMAALDAYEDVAGRLYVKLQQGVIPAAGGARRALVYVGTQTRQGQPRPGYMEGVAAAAAALGLPPAWLRELAALLPAGAPTALSAAPALQKPAVRPRFASPLDVGRS